jgi:hypothetical protein
MPLALDDDVGFRAVELAITSGEDSYCCEDGDCFWLGKSKMKRILPLKATSHIDVESSRGFR